MAKKNESVEVLAKLKRAASTRQASTVRGELSVCEGLKWFLDAEHEAHLETAIAELEWATRNYIKQLRADHARAKAEAAND